jgi:hypothetical protein
MAGILTQLPDLTEVLNNRAALLARLRGVTDPLPIDPATLTANLTEGLGALRAAVPSDPQALVAPLQTAFAALQQSFPSGQLGAVQELAAGLSQGFTVIEPAREVLASGDGLRDLREVIFEKAGDPSVMVGRLLQEVTRLIPGDSVEVLQTFVTTLREFEAQVPSSADAVARFLAQGFLGMPVDLLAAPLRVVESFYARIDGLVDSAALSRLETDIQTAATQLASAELLLRNLDPADAAAYQTAADAVRQVQTTITRVGATLAALASGFQNGLAALDLNGFTGSLRQALEDLPEVSVAQVDDFLNLATEPLRQINRQLEELSPDQVAHAFEGGGAFFARMIADEGFDEFRDALLKPFQDVGSAIAGLDLDRVRTAIVGVIGTVGDGVSQAGTAIARVREDIKTVLDRLTAVLNTVNVAGREVESAVQGLATQVHGALDALPLADFGRQVEAVIAQLGRLLDDFARNISPAVDSLQRVREELETIDLRRSADPAFDAIEAAKSVLEKLDLSLVAGDQASVLRFKLEVLVDIDLGPVRQQLLKAYDEAVPRAPFGDLAAKYQSLTARMADYSPGALLDPLLPTFAQLEQRLNQFDPAAVIDPVIPQLEAAKAALIRISPDRLIAPLAQSFDEVASAMNAFAPSRVLAPLATAFQELRVLLDKLDVAPLLKDLEQLFAETLATSLSGLQQAAGGFGGAGDLKSYIDGIPGTPEGPEFGLMPGDILRPVQSLFEKITSLLDRVPEDTLLGAFRTLQSQFTGALEAIDPSRLGVDVTGRLRGRLARFDVLNNFEVLAPLSTPFSNLVVQFDAIDPVSVPAGLRPRYEELAALIQAVDPARVLGPLRSQFKGLNGSLRSLTAKFETRELAPVFGPVKTRLDALIPAYLQGDLNLAEIRRQIDQLSPRHIADDINREFETFLLRITKFGDTLVSALPKLATAIQAGTASFVPELLKDAFDAVYQPLKTQLLALDPAALIAELESEVFQPVRAALESLNPRIVFSELDIGGRFNELVATVDVLVEGLRTVQRAVSSLWRELLAGLAQFDPAGQKAQADAAFLPAQRFISELDLVRALESLDQALVRIRRDLERVLEDAEVALQEMVLAIPR